VCSSDLKLVKAIENQADGSYAGKVIELALDAKFPIRTLRHESLHALKELGFFTDAQWKSLSKMAKDKWIDQYLKKRNVDGKPLKAGEEVIVAYGSKYTKAIREYNREEESLRTGLAKIPLSKMLPCVLCKREAPKRLMYYDYKIKGFRHKMIFPCVNLSKKLTEAIMKVTLYGLDTWMYRFIHD
jgi:hypothetical protein